MRINLIILVCLVGCAKPPADAVSKAAPPANVSVIKPQKQSLKRIIEQPGTIQADEEAQLVAKLPGFVRKIHADIGQSVRGPKIDSKGDEIEPGEILAELSIPELEDALKQKLALVRQAEAEVEQQAKALQSAEAHVTAAYATVAEAKAGLGKAQALYDRWKSESERTRGLAERGVIDAQTRDETLSQFKAAEAGQHEALAKVTTAEATYRKAQADRAKVEADGKAADAKREVAEADARQVRTLLGYSKIRAPFTGVVTSRRINTGDFLAGGGKPAVYTIARLDPVRVIIPVPEADAGLIADGLAVTLTLRALKRELAGKISRTSWALESGSRTLRAEVDVPNKEAKLRPGTYVNARITVDFPPAWTVPTAAIARHNDQPVCFMIRDGKAIRTPIRTGRADGKQIELLQWCGSSSVDSWHDFTGEESLATPAASLVDGQAISAGKP